GLLLDPGAEARGTDGPGAVVCRDPETPRTVAIREPGIYQVDVHPSRGRPQTVTLALGERRFSANWQQPAFLAVRLDAGDPSVRAVAPGPGRLDRVVLTPLDEGHDIARRFAAFERRSPRLGVHLGLRRDCGSTMARVGAPQTVASEELARFVFEGAIRNF